MRPKNCPILEWCIPFEDQKSITSRVARKLLASESNGDFARSFHPREEVNDFLRACGVSILPRDINRKIIKETPNSKLQDLPNKSNDSRRIN